MTSRVAHVDHNLYQSVVLASRGRAKNNEQERVDEESHSFSSDSSFTEDFNEGERKIVTTIQVCQPEGLPVSRLRSPLLSEIKAP